MEDAGQRERMGQPVGFLDVLTLEPGLGVWTGLTSRDHGPVGGRRAAEKDQHTAGPHSLRCQCGQDTGASGAQPQVGPGSWSPATGGAPEGRWMWGVTHLDLSESLRLL